MHRAFTLIELLVVITIIVVLLALLAPALDQAIYQAELAVCAANQRGIGSGVMQYALNHRRTYPKHIANTPNTGPSMFMVAGEDSARPARNIDLRPNLAGYVDLKLLVEPLAGGIDISEKPDTYNEFVWSAYALWFGWSYRGEAAGMKKVGDRVTLTTANPVPPPGIVARDLRLNILASDLDLIHEGALVTSAHPDKGGVLSLVKYQDAETRSGGAVEDTAFAAQNVRLTYSWWFVGGGIHQRGPADYNFLYGDGAVIRYNDVTWNEPDRPGGRMAKLPWVPNSPEAGLPLRRVQLPER